MAKSSWIENTELGPLMHYENRESSPCADNDHKFPGEFYDCAADCKAADDFCCLSCGWSFGEIERRNIDWPRRFELARKVAEAVERDLVREIERLRGERDRLADRLEASQRNLQSSRAQYSEMARARNAACSIADDAAQLRDDAFEWLAKIDEIRKIGF